MNNAVLVVSGAMLSVALYATYRDPPITTDADPDGTDADPDFDPDYTRVDVDETGDPRPGRPVREGLKFPSVKSITRPIIKPVQEVGKKVTKIPKTITAEINKVEQKITKGISSVEKKVTGEIKAIGAKIAKLFQPVIDAVVKGIRFIIFFPQCFLWYAINVTGYILYAPVAFFVWMFGLSAFEKIFFSWVDLVDKYVHEYTGVHPFHFSDDIQNRCYFANKKSSARRGTNGSSVVEMLLDDSSIDDSNTLGYLVFLFLAFSSVWIVGRSALG